MEKDKLDEELMTAKEFQPYGEEWEKELMKLPKKFIINLYRGVCMQYHHSITDSDIEAYLIEKEMSFNKTGDKFKYSTIFKLYFTEGAKAFRDGEIKHIEK